MKKIAIAFAFVLGLAAAPAMAQSNLEPAGHLALDEPQALAHGLNPVLFTPEVRLGMTSAGTVRWNAGLKLRGQQYFLFGNGCEKPVAAPLAGSIERAWNSMLADARPEQLDKGATPAMFSPLSSNFVSMTGSKPVGAATGPARGTRTDALVAMARAMLAAACRKSDDDGSVAALTARVADLNALLPPAKKP